jgi:hypothetical protein
MILDNMNSHEDGQGREVSHVFLIMSAETILFLSATMLVVKQCKQIIDGLGLSYVSCIGSWI